MNTQSTVFDNASAEVTTSDRILQIALATWRQENFVAAAGGSSAPYETSPLQRRLRDLHTAAQHFSAQPRQYVRAGKLLLGQFRRQFEDRRRLTCSAAENEFPVPREFRH